MPSFLEESEDACSGYGSTSRARRGVTEFTEESTGERQRFQLGSEDIPIDRVYGVPTTGTGNTGVGIRAHGSMYIMARGEGPVLHRKKRMTWR